MASITSFFRKTPVPSLKAYFATKSFTLPSSVVWTDPESDVVAALIDALKTKAIFSAGLDVFEDEPNVPTELIASPLPATHCGRQSATLSDATRFPSRPNPPNDQLPQSEDHWTQGHRTPA